MAVIFGVFTQGI